MLCLHVKTDTRRAIKSNETQISTFVYDLYILFGLQKNKYVFEAYYHLLSQLVKYFLLLLLFYGLLAFNAYDYDNNSNIKNKYDTKNNKKIK